MPCFNPITVNNGCNEVNCGKCPVCMYRRAYGWAFRLEQQSMRCATALFTTLTYDTRAVPITKRGFMTLNKNDVQLYMKRLRKRNPWLKLKYFTCGEYGTKNGRPHYHQILFNADPDTIHDAWQYGNIHIGAVTGGSIAYVLKYMMKESKVPMHQNDDRLKEFQLFSKGLGENYLTPQAIAWHKADLLERNYMPQKGGKRVAMPRYYRNKIYSPGEWDQVVVRIHEKAMLRMEEYQTAMVQEFGDEWLSIKVQREHAAYKKMYSSAIKNRS